MAWVAVCVCVCVEGGEVTVCVSATLSFLFEVASGRAGGGRRGGGLSGRG